MVWFPDNSTSCVVTVSLAITDAADEMIRRAVSTSARVLMVLGNSHPPSNHCSRDSNRESLQEAIFQPNSNQVGLSRFELESGDPQPPSIGQANPQALNLKLSMSIIDSLTRCTERCNLGNEFDM